MKRWDAQRNRDHYFIGCSDFHDKTHAVTGDQMQKIEQLLTQCDKKNTNVVVEDLSSANDSGRLACGRFMVNSRGGILGGLAEKGRTMGLSVDNVEFRLCRVTSLGPVLNNLHADMNNFPSASTVLVAALRDEVLHEIAQIQAYEDGPIAKKMYAQGIHDAKNQLKELHIDRHQQMTIADFLNTHAKPEGRLELLKTLLTFDSGLLDLKIVHSVMNAQDKQKSIAIAGGSHIGRVGELLEKFGYQHVKTTKVIFGREHNLQKCLGSHIIDGAFCMKPEPINLDFLDAVILSQ